MKYTFTLSFLLGYYELLFVISHIREISSIEEFRKKSMLPRPGLESK